MIDLLNSRLTLEVIEERRDKTQLAKVPNSMVEITSEPMLTRLEDLMLVASL
jgi:hypothetical protein